MIKKLCFYSRSSLLIVRSSYFAFALYIFKLLVKLFASNIIFTSDWLNVVIIQALVLNVYLNPYHDSSSLIQFHNFSIFFMLRVRRRIVKRRVGVKFFLLIKLQKNLKKLMCHILIVVKKKNIYSWTFFRRTFELF